MRLKDLLMQSGSLGLTKTELRIQTKTAERKKMSRPTIDTHLRDFEGKKEVTRRGRHFVWAANIEAAEAIRMLTFKHAYRMMRKVKTDFERRGHISAEQAEFQLQGFLNSNCITFIGDVPCTFPKSAEGLQGHIALKNSLQQHHSAALAKYREEFMESRSLEERKRVDARIRDEVGWTIGEYFKKLLKKTEKGDIISMYKNIFGVSEEELRELELARQAAEFDRSTDFDRPECIECFEKGSPYCFRQCPRNI
jgi:hypothetical protein